MNMPERRNEDPLIVSCGMRLLDITKIDTLNYGFSMSVFLQFIWTDNRVTMEAANKTDVNLHLSFIELLWVPDFYIYDLQSFRTYQLLKAYNNCTTSKGKLTREFANSEFILTLRIQNSF